MHPLASPSEAATRASNADCRRVVRRDRRVASVAEQSLDVGEERVIDVALLAVDHVGRLPVATLDQPDPRPGRGEPREVSGAVSQIRLEDDPHLLGAVFLAHLLEQADRRLDVAGLLHVDPHERVHLTRAVQHSPQLGSAEVRPDVESDLGELHGDVGVEPGRTQPAERRDCLVGGRDRLRLAPDVGADVVQRALDAFAR